MAVGYFHDRPRCEPLRVLYMSEVNGDRKELGLPSDVLKKSVRGFKKTA